MKTALLVVERDFLATHIGVRRVVLFYWRRLEEAGYQITLATPADRALLVSRPVALADVTAAINRRRSDAPDWCSNDKHDVWDRAVRERRPPDILKWSAVEVSADDFSLSIITNPWLCANGFPKTRFSAGIVYDMVPSLLACGALRLGTATDIYRFAHAHDVGYRIYQRQADTILAISDSARTDFLAFYQSEAGLAERTGVVIPFEPPISARIKAREAMTLDRPKLLLVNVLDPRKNFSGVERTVKLAMKEQAFDVNVVGRERISGADARMFLSGLQKAGGRVRWYRSASDACLQRLYGDADVLLFPSLYEGLGLPILEAQSHGTPVVSSNNSSCGEVNMNPSLTFVPGDAQGQARAMLQVFAGDANGVAGPALAARQSVFLAGRSALPVNWLQDKLQPGTDKPGPRGHGLLTRHSRRRKG